MKLVVVGFVALATTLVFGEAASAKCTDDLAVALARAQVAVACPCGAFANHGQYVRCAREVANDFADLDLLPKTCKASVVSCAARSTHGARSPIPRAWSSSDAG